MKNAKEEAKKKTAQDHHKPIGPKSKHPIELNQTH